MAGKFCRPRQLEGGRDTVSGSCWTGGKSISCCLYTKSDQHQNNEESSQPSGPESSISMVFLNVLRTSKFRFDCP